MKENNSILLIGLGNPGPKYSLNRHNVGFMFVDLLAKTLNQSFKEKSNHLICLAESEGKKIILVKPTLYMNLSGIPTLHVANYYKVNPENIILAYDDISLPVGKIRIRKQGSAGGHNGVKSVIENLGKDNFNRIRLGIGENKNIPLEQYVLSNFTKSEDKLVQEMLSTGLNVFHEILKYGVDSAMNKYNAGN